MGGVVDGQSVDQAITNPAFLFKNSNDTSFVVYTLAAPTSGPQINDIQNTINVLINGVGGNQSNPATAYSGVPSNTVLQGSTLNTAIVALADKFFGAVTAGGHHHSGVDGDGAPVAAVLSLAATGLASLTGNVVISGDGKFITIGEAGSPASVITIGFSDYGLSDTLSVNNVASAGINFNGGAISSLSYIDWQEAGFPPGYPATGHVYMAASADDHFYAKTSASATHRIDTSLAASGNTVLYGDIVLAASGGVVLNQSGQVITIFAPTGGGGVSLAATTVTTNYVIPTSIDVIWSNGATQLTLSAASAATLSPYYIQNISSTSVNVVTNGTDLINGATAFTLGSIYDSITLIPRSPSSWSMY